MTQFWWYASRATGVVATVLIIAALVWGFFFSARNTGARRSPAWWLDLHTWLGGLALILTGLHLLAAYLDTNSGVGFVDLVVPGTGPTSITWGVIAMYLLAAAVLTSWPGKRLRPVAWRLVHLGSVVAAALAGVHAYQAGSDRSTLVFKVGLAVGGAFGVYAALVRLLGVVLGRRRHSQPRHR